LCVSLLYNWLKRFIKYWYLRYCHHSAQEGLKVEESESQREFSNDETTSIDVNKHNICQTCGEEYGRPILAEIISGSSPEEYYACSRCLCKIAEAGKRSAPAHEEPAIEEEIEEEIEGEQKEVNNIVMNKIEVEVQASCRHELGYLKKRDRGLSIPDECLICPKMIECM